MYKEYNYFDFFRSRLKFENPGDFYSIHILFRIKDINENSPEISKVIIKNRIPNINPFIGINGTIEECYDFRNTRSLCDYFIYSLEDFDMYKDEIICLCKTLNARAYIYDYKQNNNQILKVINHQSKKENIKKNIKCFTDNFTLSVIDQNDKKYQFDVDEPEKPMFDLMLNDIIKNNLLYYIETPHGYHIVYRDYDLSIKEKLNEIFPNKSIHYLPIILLYAYVDIKN
jgi:hypothetical protein